MMCGRLEKLLEEVPRNVSFKDVVDLNEMNGRMGCTNVLFVNILGVNRGFVEWCPNDDPPSWSESLAWTWFIRPDLGDKTAPLALADLRTLIEDHGRNDLDGWHRLLRGDG